MHIPIITLRLSLMDSVHSSPGSGQSVSQQTFLLLRNRYWWPSMTQCHSVCARFVQVGPEKRSWVPHDDNFDPSLLTEFHANHPSHPASRGRGCPRHRPSQSSGAACGGGVTVTHKNQHFTNTQILVSSTTMCVIAQLPFCIQTYSSDSSSSVHNFLQSCA